MLNQLKKKYFYWKIRLGFAQFFCFRYCIAKCNFKRLLQPPFIAVSIISIALLISPISSRFQIESGLLRLFRYGQNSERKLPEIIFLLRSIYFVLLFIKTLTVCLLNAFLRCFTFSIEQFHVCASCNRRKLNSFEVGIVKLTPTPKRSTSYEKVLKVFFISTCFSFIGLAGIVDQSTIEKNPYDFL